MADRLSLALLGNPEIQRGGEPVVGFRSAKAYALLYYLAITRRAQSRTLLADLFWGEMGDYNARRNLNRTLSNVSQLVGEHLVITRQSVAFGQHLPYWLDVELLEQATMLPPSPQTIATLVAAVDLYRADLLDGFYVQEAPTFEHWVSAERLRLRTNVLQLLQTIATYYSEQGVLPTAIEYTRRALQMEPWREEAHCQLMRLLAQYGQRSAALAQFEQCRQLLHEELAVEPAATTLALVAQIRNGEIGTIADPYPTSVVTPTSSATETRDTVDRPPHNLPHRQTPFIGRQTEVAALTDLLTAQRDCRLVTVIGPGGMGKTRLAIHVAEVLLANANHARHFRDGIFFVPLEHVTDVTGVVSAVMAAIGAERGLTRPDMTAPLLQLAQFLRTKAMLLVLDNFEQLVAHAALCSTLLAAAPRLTLLVTSRASLALEEAWLYPLHGLTTEYDQSAAERAQAESDAVRLFAQCAQRVNPAFALVAERAAVVRICTLVEGMPLAIELAAAWRKVMTCTQIEAEMAQSLDFLHTRHQNSPTRHRSMRTVMAQSWALLTAAEAHAMARLSIFRGRFHQHAARAVSGVALSTLVALVEKALVRATADGYYHLHELTRQYADEHLSAEGRQTLLEVHATYYADLIGEQQGRLFTPAYRQAWAGVANEADNIRYAWQWILAAADDTQSQLPTAKLLCQMADVLTNYHFAHTLWLAGEALFEEACARLCQVGWATSTAVDASGGSQSATLIHLQIQLARFQMELGRYRTSVALVEEILPRCRAIGLPADRCALLIVYGQIQVRRGVRRVAATLFTEALALGEALQQPRYAAEALIGLGLAASGDGQYTVAQGYYHRALTLCQAMGYRPWLARLYVNLGTTYSRQALYVQAQSFYEAALPLARDEGDQNLIMICTSNIGGVYRGIGRHVDAITHYQRSLTMARNLGETRWVAANLNGLALTYLATGDLSAVDQTLREAVQIGEQSDSLPDLMGSIGLFGHLFAQQGHPDRALGLLLFVEAHPATMARDRHYNEALLAELQGELSPALVAEAGRWATTCPLEQVVRALLHDGLLLSA